MNDLALICETCRLPVAGDTGSLYVRLAEVNAARQASRRPTAGTALDITLLLAVPEDIRWRTAHDSCRDDRDEACYEIDAPQIATWPHAARWTAHLMSKSWFALSDWDALLRELSGETPAKRIRVLAGQAA